MKQYIRFLTMMAAALLTGSCSEELADGFLDGGEGKEKMVTVVMSVAQTPKAELTTRALDDDEDCTLRSLTAVVFDENGYLKTVSEAVPTDADGNEQQAFSTVNVTNGDRAYFKVKLPVANDLIIHLIGNKDVNQLPFGSEGQLIGTMQTEGGADEDVYWQRIEGIDVPDAKTAEEIAQGDDIITIADHLTTHPTLAKLQNVPLVCNWAKVSLELDPGVTTFQLTAWALTNIPDRGTVAPRIISNQFANYVKWNSTTSRYDCPTYNELSSQGYNGNEAIGQTFYNAPAIVTDDEVEPDEWVWHAPDKPFFIYEHRNVGAKNVMTLIVKGKYSATGNFDGVEDTYYKLAMIYEDAYHRNHYYNILRNLQYKVVINGVSEAGFASLKKVVLLPSSNNLSGSTLIEDMTNLSDGVNHIFVDRANIVITDASQPVSFRYKYLKGIDNPSTPDGVVDNSYNHDDVTNAAVTIVTEDVSDDSQVLDPSQGSLRIGSGSTFGVSVADTDEDGWRTVTLHPREPDMTTREQRVTVVDANGLSRSVKLTLRRPYTMHVACSPEDITQMQNYPVQVKIRIPTGMRKAYFPLYFNISTSDNSLYPQANSGMTVVVNDNGTYAFRKELREADYNRLEQVTESYDGLEDDWKELVCNFMTCRTDAGDFDDDNDDSTPKKVVVSVSNDYFNTGTAMFTQTGTAVLSSVGIVGTEYYGGGQEVKVKYIVPTGGLNELTIKLVESGHDVATPVETVVNTVAGDMSAGEHTVSARTATFNGDIKFVITAKKGSDTQEVTVYNPKQRHIINSPLGSFRFDATLFPANRWHTENMYSPGTGYDKAQAAGYEWPDLFIDGVDCGGGPMTATGGTQTYPTDPNQELRDIDATYGGRDMEFHLSSIVEFKTYYNYYDAGDGLKQHPARVFRTTVGQLARWFEDSAHLSFEGFYLWRTTNYRTQVANYAHCFDADYFDNNPSVWGFWYWEGEETQP